VSGISFQRQNLKPLFIRSRQYLAVIMASIVSMNSLDSLVSMSSLKQVASRVTSALFDESESLQTEFALVILMTVAFSLHRGYKLKQLPKPAKKARKSAGTPVLFETLDTETTAGNHIAALKAWRGSLDVQLSPEAMRQVVQALLEVSSDTLVDEVVGYLMRHRSLKNAGFAFHILDVVARARDGTANGSSSLLEDLEHAFTNEMHIRTTYQMNEAILGGYAFAGQDDKLDAHLARMKASSHAGENISARANSLILRGLLRNRKADRAMLQLKEMVSQGLNVPDFAVGEVFKVFVDTGFGSEALDKSLPEIVPSSEAAGILFEHCFRSHDLNLAVRLKELLNKEKVDMTQKGFDSLLKLLALNSDHPMALQVFEEMQQQTGVLISEGFCVGLLARCAESKFLRFADEVMKFVRANMKMSVALYSAMMKVYAFSAMYDKACDIYDQLLADGLEPDQMMYNCLMKFAALSGRSELSAKLAERVPCLDIQNCMSLIRSAYHDKDVGRACSILEKLRTLGHTLDTAAYNCALDVCAAAGDANRAHVLLEEMKRSGTNPDVITFNTVLKCYATKRDTQGARRVLVSMEAAGFQPNDISYNVIINMAVSNGSFKEAWETVVMMEKKGIAIDHYTISTLMKAVKRAQYSSDVTLVFDLLDRSGVDITADEVLLNTMIETCVRHKEKARIQEVFSRYSTKTNPRPAMHTYGMLIRGNSLLRRVDKCRELFDEMVNERALEPNEIVFGCMMDALVTNGCVDEALALLREWRPRVKPNSVMYSTLLKGFAASQNANKALELLEEMRVDVVPMVTPLYNSVIDVLARNGSMKEVLAIRELMDKDGCEPDDFTMSLVVKAHCMHGSLDKAFEVFQTLSRRKSPDSLGDTVIYNTLLDGCVRRNSFQTADHLVEQMEAYNIRPTNFTLGIVVKMWGRRRQLDKAFAAMETMTKKYGFVVNNPVRSCLMSACLLNDDLPRAISTFDVFKASADSKAWCSLISGAIRLNNLEVAVRLTEEVYSLTEQKVCFTAQEVDSSVLDQLTRSLNKAGLMNSLGLPLLTKLRAKGVPVRSHIVSMLHKSSSGN
jgi:pentatricopeptide repeat protein